MKNFAYLFIVFVLASCTSDDAEIVEDGPNLLSTYIAGRTIEMGAVIACAASDNLNTDVVEVYFFPETGAVNFKLYETTTSALNPNDFSNYSVVAIDDTPFFNGTLRRFIQPLATEQWSIVTFELDGEIKLSNPIRTKNTSQPTLVSNQIDINQDESLMPLFSWNVNSEANNAIFFQVISTIDDTVLSGTYTLESNFQYYNTTNVVLNITEGVPQDLLLGQNYKITVMDVSEDNWVNELFIRQFTAE